MYLLSSLRRRPDAADSLAADTSKSNQAVHRRSLSERLDDFERHGNGKVPPSARRMTSRPLPRSIDTSDKSSNNMPNSSVRYRKAHTPSGFTNGSNCIESLDVTQEKKRPSVLQTLKTYFRFLYQMIYLAWRYVLLLLVKCKDIVLTSLTHFFRGPQKKEWGLEHALAVSVMRGIGAAHITSLADIRWIRKLFIFIGLIPVAHVAVITPVTFTVRPLGLKGFLASYDAAEDGTRELDGEWVLNRDHYRRLQHQQFSQEHRFQTKLRNERAQQAKTERPSRAKPPQSKMQAEKVILWLHGGAFYIREPHRILTIQLSKYLDCRVFALNYRLAPETNFPGPLHDAVTAYFRLIYDLNIPEVIVAGDSAGGGLVLSLLLYLRDNQYPLPSAAIVMSPWVDLTMSTESWESALDDILPTPVAGDHLDPVTCYLGEDGLKHYLTHPYVSPLFGDLCGLPPLLLQVGAEEKLYDEVTLLAHKARKSGVDTILQVYPSCVHVFQYWMYTSSAKKAFASCRAFVRQLPPRTSGCPPHERKSNKEIVSPAAMTIKIASSKMAQAMRLDATTSARTVTSPNPSNVNQN